MNAATTITATASYWMMVRNASAFRAFPARCCADGFAPPSFRWTKSWKLSCYTDRTENAVSYAGHCSSPAPTGRNTARTAPNRSAAAGKPRGNETIRAFYAFRAGKSQINQGFPVVCQQGSCMGVFRGPESGL